MVEKKKKPKAKRKAPVGHRTDKGRKIKRPQDWDKVLEVAGLRLQGATQIEAGEICDCSVRSIRLWERSDWWPMAMEAANEKWGDAVLAFARRAVLMAVREGEIATARWVLTNLDARFLKKKDEVDLNIVYSLDMPELDGDEQE